MTKLRPPLSFERALAKIAGVLGWDTVAKMVGRSVRAVRAWSDADVEGNVTMKAAAQLDAAYVAACGASPPMLATYENSLAAKTAIACEDAQRSAERAAKAAKEVGEAIAAQIIARAPGATPAQRAKAVVETEEAITSMQDTLPDLAAGAVGAAVGGQ